jgi:hypothetical protein
MLAVGPVLATSACGLKEANVAMNRARIALGCSFQISFSLAEGLRFWLRAALLDLGQSGVDEGTNDCARRIQAKPSDTWQVDVLVAFCSPYQNQRIAESRYALQETTDTPAA